MAFGTYSMFEVSFSELKRQLLGFVFQPKCCLCDSIITRSPALEPRKSMMICDDCLAGTLDSTLDRCYFCGAESHPLNPFGSRCRVCRNWKSKFERIIAIGDYRPPLKEAVIKAKREGDDITAFQLGRLWGEIHRNLIAELELDFVVSVPSHWLRRFSRRGLHVSDVIADGICAEAGLKKKSNVLKCSRFTQKQAKLRPGQRRGNVKGAFRVNGNRPVKGASILLVDDVITSGATVNECTNLLVRAGARAVFAAVAARAPGVS